MYTFKEDEMKVHCHVWSEEGSMEQEAINQIKNASSLPFAFHHTALMPDGHVGFGAPIGGVLATKGVIIPSFVGVDIGCGMCAVKTGVNEKALDIDTLKKIVGNIRKAIPVGFGHHKREQDINYMPSGGVKYLPIVDQQYKKALTQIGTLGGGNHFIELQTEANGHIWIMIHSGSRNLGYTVAKHYNYLAKDLNEKYYSQIPKSWDLAFLPLGTEEAKNYIVEMNYCVEFALQNRKLMMQRVLDIFINTFQQCEECLFSEDINIAHNYASLENHFGSNVWIHRKGATQAKEGQLGIIPGSQGTSSYIVTGRGNKESFESCSHGAGRRMGRKQAERTLDLEAEQKMLDDQNILHSVRGKGDLDEAPGAYKDIKEVMDNQKDLVDVKHKLMPLAVVKG